MAGHRTSDRTEWDRLAAPDRAFGPPSTGARSGMVRSQPVSPNAAAAMTPGGVLQCSPCEVGAPVAPLPLVSEARSLTRPSSLPRARWSERWDRPGWRQEFTVAGGRLRAGDPVSALPLQRSAMATRLLSQACFSIASDGD